MPSYQALAVAAYESAHLNPSPFPAGTFNTSGVSGDANTYKSEPNS